VSNDRLREGIDAARAGDREKARDIFQEIIEKDDNNIQAWLWLSRVVKDPDEKRICLENILLLDPQNEQAKAAIAKLETKKQITQNRDEVVPGVGRRRLTFLIFAAVVFLLAACGLTFLITSTISGQREAERRANTQVAVDLTNTQVEAGNRATSTRMAEMTEEAFATATFMATQTPPTRTPAATLPATWTPIPSPTPILERVYDLPPPEVTGRLYGWGGADTFSNGFLELRSYLIFDGGAPNNLRSQNDRVRHVTSNLRGDVLVYEQFNVTLNAWVLRSLDSTNLAAQPVELSPNFVDLRIVETTRPSLTPDGGKLVFAARNVDTRLFDIYLFDFATSVTQKLTSDGANYSDPAISADGQRVLAVRDDIQRAPGADLVLIDLTDPAVPIQSSLTNDRGATIESHPVWAPDGSAFVFAVASPDQPAQRDLWITYMIGGRPTVENVPLVTGAADDIEPVFSPNSRYLAFASDRATGYDIYIVAIADPGTIYQLTEGRFAEFPGGWGE
jgi:tetratricopeptide (TPR) repeat protein